MDSLNRYAISEVYEILMHMSEEDKNQIPEKAMKFLKDNRYKDYKSIIDYSKSLGEQKISKETLSLLTMYYMLGFCKTDAEKKEMLKMLKTNDNKGDSKNG